MDTAVIFCKAIRAYAKIHDTLITTWRCLTRILSGPIAAILTWLEWPTVMHGYSAASQFNDRWLTASNLPLFRHVNKITSDASLIIRKVLAFNLFVWAWWGSGWWMDPMSTLYQIYVCLKVSQEVTDSNAKLHLSSIFFLLPFAVILPPKDQTAWRYHWAFISSTCALLVLFVFGFLDERILKSRMHA